MKHLLSALLLASAVTGFSQNFSETSFSGLYGSGFLSNSNLTDNWDRTTLTLEHASGWKYGDNFTFLDLYDIGKTSSQDYYFEWHSRFYADPLIKLSEDNKVIKHIGLATQINIPPNGNAAYLAGPMIDFKVPGAAHFQTSWLVRNTPNLEGVSFQLTAAFRWWFGKKLKQEKSGDPMRRFFIGGFIDVKSVEGTEAAWVIFQPQLLMHVKKLSFGTEWFVYTNKFGVEGKNESVPQVMIRWVL
ncbi:hypothetical protein KFE98_17425 [bacterium SCSIO 12741]|nr:hypothetical protein KFE98_17425 [bacterium SCSIO 12741]